MDYLFLDFTDNYRKINLPGKYRRKLTEQCNDARAACGVPATVPMEDFVKMFFPERVQINYYACSFRLGYITRTPGGEYCMAIRARMPGSAVVRGEATASKDLILLGFGGYSDASVFAVKGIDVMDSRASLTAFTPVACIASCGFTARPGRVMPAFKADIGYATVLTRPLMSRLPLTCSVGGTDGMLAWTSSLAAGLEKLKRMDGNIMDREAGAQSGTADMRISSYADEDMDADQSYREWINEDPKYKNWEGDEEYRKWANSDPKYSNADSRSGTLGSGYGYSGAVAGLNEEEDLGTDGLYSGLAGAPAGGAHYGARNSMTKNKSASYLYLNCCDNLDEGSKSYDDVYATPLLSQYETLKRKLFKNSSMDMTFQGFMQTLFPNAPQTYYVSLPAFDREVTTKKNSELKKLNNIVIRVAPSITGLGSIIPPQYDVIVVGDLVFGGVTCVDVKGIDVIDRETVKNGEMEITCRAACAFTKKLNRYGRKVNSYAGLESDYDLHNEALDMNVVNDMCNYLSPVKDMGMVAMYLDKWDEYLKFRRYYLGKLSEKCEEIDAAVACDAYVISKDMYREDKENYDQCLLDGIKDFAKGEQIILGKKGAEAGDGFPLVRVDIRKNKKRVLERINARGKAEYETSLQRWTKDSMGLSSVVPEYDDDGKMKGKFSQFALGERYLFTSEDVPPDFSGLEKKYDNALRSKRKEIDDKWDGYIRSELSSEAEVEETRLKNVNEEDLDSYRTELDASLDRDIKDNRDAGVKAKANAKFKEIFSRMASAMQERASAVDEEIAKLRGKAKKAKGKGKAGKKGKGIEPSDEIAELAADAEASKNAKRLEELGAEKQELEGRIEDARKEAWTHVDMDQLYRERNESRIESRRANMEKNLSVQMGKFKGERKKQLEILYSRNREEEKKESEGILAAELERDKAALAETDTIRCYHIYFRPADQSSYEGLDENLKKAKPAYLTYDNRPERMKLERQEKALMSLRCGYVKNPYLASYLFEPESLPANEDADDDIEWFLPSLNDSQKEAVRLALKSESIFLLQGPPGTGKTQVIAELTAQFAKRGKKVLISSETHKAIDNVFERLPKTPEIRPLRLIPSSSNKETNYNPLKLVANFYTNISETLSRRIDRIENIAQDMDSFSENMKQLYMDHRKLLDVKNLCSSLKEEENGINRKLNGLVAEEESRKADIKALSIERDEYLKTTRAIDNCQFDNSDDKKMEFIKSYESSLAEISGRCGCLANITPDKYHKLINLDLNIIKEEIAGLTEADESALEQERYEIRTHMQSLRNLETDESPKPGEANYDEYVKYRNRLGEVSNKINELKNAGAGVDITTTVLYELVPSIIGDKEMLQKLPGEIMRFRAEQEKAASDIKRRIQESVDDLNGRIAGIRADLNGKEIEKNGLSMRLAEIKSDGNIKEYGRLDMELKQKITAFFSKYDIIDEYPSGDFGAAFDIIEKEWAKLQHEFSEGRAENERRIPVYKNICKYLAQEDVLDQDTRAYTPKLFDCVNVFGITCTSNSRYTSAQLEDLGKCGIDNVDIKKQGIDVVIVDEVSKSSFIDLLIPILYGKTVILVGDHRQLPPMYDLRYLKDKDFEDLDPGIITEAKNKRFQNLYEECFFKTLFERVPKGYKVMLDKQYRCHSHIMEVFNHFYGGNRDGLKVGLENQDDMKAHNLTVMLNGNLIIDPEHHVYFVDCEQKESSAYEGSTSKINEQEAEVAVELLRGLNKAAIAAGGEKPSVGVICTYGDQASLIKKKKGRTTFPGFSNKQDEKLVISTVDDFQGDERDVIIVSLVRNPATKGFDLDFIKKFERINVALSRARKILIVLGAKDFLSRNGIIDLPDIMGRKERDKNNYPVYREIINTISYRGRLLSSGQILGGNNGR